MRSFIIVITILSIVTISSCCSWAKKNCTECQKVTIITNTEFIYKTPSLLPELPKYSMILLDKNLPICHPNNLYALFLNDVRKSLYINSCNIKINRYEEEIKEIEQEIK